MMGLRGEIKEQGEGDAGTSTTTSDTEVARNPHQPKGDGGTASIFLSLLLHDVTDITSLSLREPDAVALATNATVSMKRGTKEAGGTRLRVGGTRLRVGGAAGRMISLMQ